MCIVWVANVPFRSAEDQSCTDMSGILLASCMAGTTILLLSCRKNQTGVQDHIWSPNTQALRCVVLWGGYAVIHIVTLWFPRTKKMWPNRTREQAVSLFRSSALDIFSVSLRNLLLTQVTQYGNNMTKIHHRSKHFKMINKLLLGLVVTSLEERQKPSDVKCCGS